MGDLAAGRDPLQPPKHVADIQRRDERHAASFSAGRLSPLVDIAHDFMLDFQVRLSGTLSKEPGIPRIRWS